jgi:hypothetical protein
MEKNELELNKDLKEYIINDKALFIRKVIGDGNCFYRVLSFYFTNSQNFYSYFVVFLHLYSQTLF